MAAGLTAGEFEGWYKPAQALDALPAGWSLPEKIAELLSRLQHGRIVAAAESLKLESGTTYFTIIVPGEWSDFDEDEGYHLPVWRTGRLTYDGFAAHGVRFDPAGMKELISYAAPTELPPLQWSQLHHAADPKRIAELEAKIAELEAAQQKRLPHPGGAPPKPWWDDLWVEMFRQIWESDLQPKSMSDIAEAMQQWAIDNDHEMSASTAKRAARKLWAVAKPKGS